MSKRDRIKLGAYILLGWFILIYLTTGEAFRGSAWYEFVPDFLTDYQTRHYIILSFMVLYSVFCLIVDRFFFKKHKERDYKPIVWLFLAGVLFAHFMGWWL